MITAHSIFNSAKRLLTALLLFYFLPLVGKGQDNITPPNRTVDSVLALLRTDKEDTSKASHQITLSKAYQTIGNITDATETANSAIKAAERSGQTTYIVKAYVNLASVFYYEGNYPGALDYYLKGLTISEEKKYDYGIALTTLGIGNVYKEQASYTKALEYYLKSLQINTTNKNLKGMSACYGDMGIVYWNMNDYTQALSFYLKGLQIDQQLNAKMYVAADLSNIGNIYSHSGDTAKAMANYNQSLDLYVALGNKPCIAILTGNIGEIYLRQKNIQKAEKYILASANMAQSVNDLSELKHDYLLLSSLYAYKKDWEKAYANHLNYAAVLDTLANRDNTRKIVAEEMTFEFQKKEAAEKADQEKKEIIRADQRKKQQILVFLFAAIALLIALIALFIFRLLKAAQRERLIADQQKSLMELKALRAQMNPHFLFNAINSVQHFILKNEPDAAQKHLNKFSKLIRKVLENSKQEAIPLNEEIEMLQLYTELEAVRFSSKFAYKFVVNQHLSPENLMVPPLIIQPFVENAIWHGLMHLKERQGSLTITFDKENDMLKCTVEDNGIGRKKSQELREEARHEPMGLSITHERVYLLNEVYHIAISVAVTDKTDEQGNPTGTAVTIKMPLNFNKTQNA